MPAAMGVRLAGRSRPRCRRPAVLTVAAAAALAIAAALLGAVACVTPTAAQAASTLAPEVADKTLPLEGQPSEPNPVQEFVPEPTETPEPAWRAAQCRVPGEWCSRAQPCCRGNQVCVSDKFIANGSRHCKWWFGNFRGMTLTPLSRYVMGGVGGKSRRRGEDTVCNETPGKVLRVEVELGGGTTQQWWLTEVAQALTGSALARHLFNCSVVPPWCCCRLPQVGHDVE